MDLTTEDITHLGQHSDSVSCMTWSQQQSKFFAPTSSYLITISPPIDVLITGSWDRTIRFWDPRVAQDQLSCQTQSHETPERIYHLDLIDNNLVVAMASRLFHIYDIRNMSSPSQQRESSLKYMTRSLACMPDGQGYATASTEGRIAVEYFDPSPAAQDKKYAFKCHRQTIDGVDHVWPVNALAFHPKYNTFASAGSDGTVSIWDHKVKKRLRQYPKFNNPVSSVAFNSDGSKLAMGVSYTWDEGEDGVKTAQQPILAIRKLGEEVKVRPSFVLVLFSPC